MNNYFGGNEDPLVEQERRLRVHIFHELRLTGSVHSLENSHRIKAEIERLSSLGIDPATTMGERSLPGQTYTHFDSNVGRPIGSFNTPSPTGGVSNWFRQNMKSQYQQPIRPQLDPIPSFPFRGSNNSIRNDNYVSPFTTTSTSYQSLFTSNYRSPWSTQGISFNNSYQPSWGGSQYNQISPIERWSQENDCRSIEDYLRHLSEGRVLDPMIAWHMFLNKAVRHVLEEGV